MSMSISTNLDHLENDLQVLWGAAAIGAVIGRTKRQTYHMLTRGELKGAKLIGGRWCITREALRAIFGDEVQ